MARTEAVWQEIAGSYLTTQWAQGRDILINGTNKYLNFGSLSGSSGYGFRDNAGTMEYKNSGGAWAAITGGGGGPEVDTLATVTARGSTTTTDIEITDTTKGLILKSPIGTRFRIGITDNGELTATSI